MIGLARPVGTGRIGLLQNNSNFTAGVGRETVEAHEYTNVELNKQVSGVQYNERSMKQDSWMWSV